MLHTNKIQKTENLKNSVFVCATDTLYGICTSALSKKNVERIYELKERTDTKPFIILIEDTRDLDKFGIKLTQKERAFLDEIWPGKVSVVLPCPLKKFEYLHRGTESLAFRMPKKNSIRDILEVTGPLVAPSANVEGEEPAQTVTEAREIFGDAVDVYISDGKLAGAPSTIITFKDDKLVCLREGAVAFEQLKKTFEEK